MGVKESSSNEAMPRRWLRRASGALARRAAGAGAALARGRASVTHDDSAGGRKDSPVARDDFLAFFALVQVLAPRRMGAVRYSCLNPRPKDE